MLQGDDAAGMLYNWPSHLHQDYARLSITPMAGPTASSGGLDVLEERSAQLNSTRLVLVRATDMPNGSYSAVAHCCLGSGLVPPWWEHVPGRHSIPAAVPMRFT